METEKIITYSAIGVAGLVCLIFLLDLAAGIFGRHVAMDILFIIGIGILALARGRDGAGTALMRLQACRMDRGAHATAVPVRLVGTVRGDRA